jgi:hypothetical protein
MQFTWQMFQVGIIPYTSPSEQQVSDRLAAETETHNLAELSDNFHEQALMQMMDSVLEVRWEDEIKKDIPKPKCMVSYSDYYLLPHVNFGFDILI